MRNAKRELIGALNGGKIKCASITHGSSWDEDSHSKHILKVGYSKEELDVFLESLDFKYDNGYGGQELYGTVWLKDGESWLTRGEYDGSEWWEYNKLPEIPDELK